MTLNPDDLAVLAAELQPDGDLRQPISDVQLKQLVIEWVPYAQVKPNRYNPNKMTGQDRALLRQSLLEDGWTQPIVTLLDGTIVDGEQRWTTAGLPLQVADVDGVLAKMLERKDDGYPVSTSILARLVESRRRLAEIEGRGEVGTLASITGGLVPVTRVDFWDDAHKMISTIRHNRARGTHHIDRMAEIAQDLTQLGLDLEDLETRLGMDDEEARRLLEQAELPDQLDIAGPSKAWRISHLSDLSDDQLAQKELERSQAAAEQAKQHQVETLQREREIEAETNKRIADAEARGQTLTQLDKARLEKEIAQAIPAPAKPKPPELRRFSFYITPEEYEICNQVLGQPPVNGFVQLCRDEYERRFGGQG